MDSMAFKETTKLSTDYMSYLHDSMAKVKHIYGDFDYTPGNHHKEHS